MEVIRDLEKMNNELTAVTIGKFDGVHQGHRELVKTMLAEGKDLKKVIFTFELLGSFNNVVSKKPIYSEEKKEEVFESLGIDYYVLLTLDEKLAAMEPEAFVKDILVDKLKCKLLVCGKDFRFGRNRAGDVEMLGLLASKYDFRLIAIEKKQYLGEDISSTRIRKALEANEKEALDMLYGPCKNS